MSETGWAEIIAGNREEESAVQRSARQAMQAAERQDRAELAAEAERAAAIEDERDRRLFRYGQLGIAARSTAEVFADASVAGDEDGEYEAARATVARIERRRARRAEAMRFQAEQLEAVSRSAVPADPLEAATRRAHREFAATTRHMLSAAATGTPRARRPKEASRGGTAVRSENCIHCIEANASDEEAFLLHSDPQHPLPVTPPQQPVQAERRRVPMIYAGTEAVR